MIIEHKRTYNKRKDGDGGYCIGHVYINGKYSHDTIEDYDRGLTQEMTEAEARAIKVYGKTAIPTGEYTVKMNIRSPKFSQKEYYRKLCDGKVPRLDPVVGFSGILIHIGNTEADSAGCVLVGRNTIVGRVTHSTETFERLYRLLRMTADRGERIVYRITRSY